MSRKVRHWSVEEKIRIMEEARAPGATVAEVLQRHGIDTTTYYSWEKQAKEGIRQALAGKPGNRGAKDREIERLKSEVERKSRIIAEVVEENLGLKKGI
jgi:transposase